MSDLRTDAADASGDDAPGDADDDGNAVVAEGPDPESGATPARPSTWWGGAPWVVALVVVLLASGFVAVRWEVAAENQVGYFVQSGEVIADPENPPQDVPVLEDSWGYDGQYFWRLANDPFETGSAYNEGMLLDTPYRAQRIAYPFIAFVITGGGRLSVSWALIGINVAAMGAIGALGALEAQRRGLTGWFGLSVAAIPAFVFSLSRDLAEPLACAFLLAAVLALRRERWGWAAAAFSAAVLTREQIVFVVGVYGLTRLWTLVKDRSKPTGADLPWIVPGVAFASLQLVLYLAIGAVPVLEGGDSNLALPFTDLVPAVGDWTNFWPGITWPHVWGTPIPVVVDKVRAMPELALMVVLVIAALLAPLPRRQLWERGAVALMAVLAVSLATVVWDGPADLRTTADLAIMCWAIVLAASPRRVLVPLAIATPLVALLPAFALVYLQ